MDEKYNAIVLKTAPYRDNDKMLTLFTLENGIISACLKGVKKPNAKLKFAGEMFCFGEYSFAEKSGRRTVIEVNQIDSFYSIRLDMDKFYVANSCCEFVSKFMLGGMKSYDIFLLLVNVLKALNETDINPKTILVCFYLEALKFTGYELDFLNCFSCGGDILKRAFFNFEDGVAKCIECATAFDTEIKFSTYVLLRDISQSIKNQDNFFAVLKDYDDICLKNALRFLGFFISQKAGVDIKSHTYFTE